MRDRWIASQSLAEVRMRDRLEDVESFARLRAPFAGREEVLRAAQTPAATSLDTGERRRNEENEEA